MLPCSALSEQQKLKEEWDKTLSFERVKRVEKFSTHDVRSNNNIYVKTIQYTHTIY